MQIDDLYLYLKCHSFIIDRLSSFANLILSLCDNKVWCAKDCFYFNNACHVATGSLFTWPHCRYRCYIWRQYRTQSSLISLYLCTQYGCGQNLSNFLPESLNKTAPSHRFRFSHLEEDKLKYNFLDFLDPETALN